ncbi:2-keto-4-pentenoate hydratase [Ahniella affigens]|uniref:2-keto-4-pentenoate hydratase n=1 Tax=Ahniella affigens TaxID=2021234 RepID=UPI001F0B86D1|nr:2-keto-4-pentenoate hydratase [Ahniella affigens]
MTESYRVTETVSESLGVASRFVAARRGALALTHYPGPLPENLETAYQRQDQAIGLWPDQLCGWKVGRIPDLWLARMGEDRLMGPVFQRQCLWLQPGQTAELPVIQDGFAAVEAEYIFVLGTDADPQRSDYTPEEALQLAGSFHIGIELAGSPLATINALGPAIVVSDFGNNAGVFVGPDIPSWHSLDLLRLNCSTYVDGALVGQGGGWFLPGGPAAALAFALNRGAKRHRPLKAGMLVSTGAATGIHDILPNQQARLVFDGIGELTARGIPATPMPEAEAS